MNKEWYVTVEKYQYCSGTVKVKAPSPERALEIINEKINSGKLQTTSVDWSEPTYEDGTFNPTGDVDEA